MSYEQLLYAVSDCIATITLNRPNQLNAWTPQMEEEMRSAVGAAETDGNVAAIVITGAGRGFCAGFDLSGVAKPKSTEIPPGGHRFAFLQNAAKPLFAAINGPAAGVGLSIALYCDFRYMIEGSQVATSFAKRGLIAEHGSAWLLPRLVGVQNAMELLLSGDTYSTEQAATMGLVHALPVQGFLAEVTRRARALAETSSPRSMRVIKRQIHASFCQTLDEAAHMADHEQALSVKSEDCREGIAAFRERRPAQFIGR